MAEVQRTTDDTTITFTQEWPTVTYTTEQCYGIDRNPQTYRPLKDLLDQDYEFTAQVKRDNLRHLYVITVQFRVPETAVSFHCLKYPQATFRF